ncbi:5'-nucleotidase, lipoprotein e(P4) family [Cytobacillus sp. IB215316]|uniref:5'-nucleotidase, lipoprotein e(P4) family n=1 Tax=Cytobacillus sp. IB215316 TaxID=3097354 RepID=UPI002A12C572|nr:5'-nucleotidase, lipoprotein e(P4) family [Cytobacillus sp. IB215316]MDX8360809.1 5'-nucleotidase, lipoprotein e(P4) family [Cytobacillus sp. IB215316]
MCSKLYLIRIGFVSALCFAIITGCGTPNANEETGENAAGEETTEEQNETNEEAPQASTVNIPAENIMSTLWHQTSGERNALYYQGYNIGKMMLDQNLTENIEKKRAIVLDLDETVLDNDPYQAYAAVNEVEYPEGWDDWINSASAELLPGALEFLQYADEQGVDIYYISNRKEEQKEATIKNMEYHGIPQSTEDRILLKTDESSKKARRDQVLADHEIILLFGDNLADFADVFDKQTVPERNSSVDDLKADFGSKFIVFPNPMYGDWEGAVYDFNWDLTPEEKDDKRKKAMKPFERAS